MNGNVQAPPGSFLRSVLTLFTGTVVAQAIPFLCAPLIARLYDAQQFAVFGTLMAVFNILSVVAAGRYEMAVVLPKDDRESGELVRGGLMIAGATSVISVVLLPILASSASLSARLPGLTDVIWVVAVLACIAGLQMVLQQWLLRKQRFRAIAQVKVMQAVAITAATLALGHAGARNGLAIGYLAGWLCFGVATVWWVLRREPLPRGWSITGVREALHRFRAWPLVNVWPTLVNAFASGMPVFYMTGFFTPYIAGQHNFARQYLLVPIAMISVALGQVLFIRSAQQVRDGAPLLPGLMRVFRILVVLGLCACAILFFFGEPLFTLVFGQQWAFAGTAARVLIFSYAMQLAMAPFAVVLLALGRLKQTLIFPLVYLGLMAFPPLFAHATPLHFMAGLSALEALAYAVQGMVVLQAARMYEAQRILQAGR